MNQTNSTAPGQQSRDRQGADTQSLDPETPRSAPRGAPQNAALRCTANQPDRSSPLRPLQWIGDLDGHVEMIDQTLLPNEFKLLTCNDVDIIHDAIRRLAVRGAPAIGVAAAMGVVLGVRDVDTPTRDAFVERVDQVCDYLAGTRPTARNLFWALDRMRDRARAHAGGDIAAIKSALLAEAQAIRDEDAAMCKRIGDHGHHLIPEGGTVITHCNAGALATAEYGTALAVMYRAHELGRTFTVYVDETRPLLQGARLTAWELQRAGIKTVLICDNMAGHVMKTRGVDLVVTGADRIAANGDAANKIGTYSLAVLAKAHNVPFHIAAPSSTFDLSLTTGTDIPIEERSPDEIRSGFGRLTAPANIPTFCPAFDVTPAELITSIITERGLIEPVTTANVTANVVRGECGVQTA